MRWLFCKYRIFYCGTETFNNQKHNILFQFNQGEKLRSLISTIEISILGVAEIGSAILQVKDIKSGTINDVLTPNRNLIISGNKIKIAGNNPSIGIYFINTETEDRIVVDTNDIVINNPSELIVVIPNLLPATYTIEVVTQYAVGTLLKEPRTASFDKILSIL
ncbi:DUF4469 domain-containing protein [Empedobacter tilapiae]|uniref:DUF4469 domain-containing protein n=1 Tax=Empedobacter tilapiae TaxID=2491114 RepID=UPI001C88C8CF|nr:DUF4469 domain-containing protein [Empedobacter tilapiae]